jgi:GT2 family glycosyltransferase
MLESNGWLTPQVACVVVNWNNWQDTTKCLTSLREQSYQNLQVIVVDNGSSNDSVVRLRAEHPWVTVVENGYNAGFSKACNTGAALGMERGADLVWLLNNDVVAPSDTAAKLVRTAVENPQAGVVGSVLYYMHEPGRIQAWGGGKINLWTGYSRHFIKPEEFGSNSYITFASAVIRRALYEELGGLYEGSFMYFEDSDFGLRAQRTGWKLCVAQDTAILHKEGGSFEGKRNPVLERIVTMSGLSFLKRHASIPPVAIVLFLGMKIGKRVMLREWIALRAVLRGTRDWWMKKPIAVE